MTRSHPLPMTRHIIYHEVFEDDEWQVTDDTLDVESVTVHEAGDVGIIEFSGPEARLLVNASNFIRAHTHGVE